MCDNPKNVWMPDNYEDDQEMFPRGLYRADLDGEYDIDRDIEFIGTTMQPTKIARAILAGKPPNLIGSKIHKTTLVNRYHAPLVDLDQRTRIKKSSTRGHYHILMDQYVDTEHYKDMLDSLRRAGIVQEGFFRQLEKFGQTFLRWNALKGEGDG